jgi:hypothetical protein
MFTETGIYWLMLFATLAAFATFVVIVWAGLRQRDRDCDLDPTRC